MLTANGGPCATPFAFWTNPEAARLMRQHLRYAIARWGYSPNLMAWELCNEVEGRDSESQELPEVTRWHQEQARFIKHTDPAGHLVSSSSNLKKGHAVEGQALWRLPEMDFCQTHLYGAWGYPDPAVDFPRVARPYQAAYAKPIFFGEYGIGPDESTGQPDPLGLYIHNALFSAALDGPGAGAANWFVDELLKQGHERHLATFGRFVAELPWNDPGLKPLRCSQLKTVATGAAVYRDVSITPQCQEPFKKMDHERFVVNPVTREISDIQFLQKYLHAMKNRKSRPTFLLDGAVPAEFVVTVSRSVGDERNALIIALDGKEVVTQPFPAGKNFGTNAVPAAGHGNWSCDYNDAVKVAVPAGRHEVRLEAVGKDRLEVGYRILHYSAACDPVAVVGRGTQDRAWLWVRNQLSTDENERHDIKPGPIGSASATIEGLADGIYKIAFSDPWSERVFPVTEVACSQGRLELKIPGFTRSLLCTVRRLP